MLFYNIFLYIFFHFNQKNTFVSQQIQQIQHLNKEKNKTHGTEINRSTEKIPVTPIGLYLFDTLLSI
jgi:hypothetical protein